MKKVLIIGQRAPESDGGILVGGTQKVPYKVYKAIAFKDDVDACFWYFEGPKRAGSAHELKKFYKIRTIPAKLYIKTLSRELALLVSWRDLKKFDVIQVHHPHFALAIGFLKLLNIIKAKVIVKAHGTAVPENGSQKHQSMRKFVLGLNAFFHKIHDKISLKLSDIVLISSKFQAFEMQKIYKVNSAKIRVIYNGFDDDYFFHNEVNHKRITPELMFIGRVVEKKNILYAIEIKKELDKLYSEPIKLTIVAGESKKVENKGLYKRILNEIGSLNSIELQHDLSEEQLAARLRKSSILLVTSQIYESIPSVIYEGLATKNYVLATKDWGIPEILGSSLYLNHSIHDDVKTIVHVTNKCLLNPVDTKPFSYKMLAAKYRELYDDDK